MIPKPVTRAMELELQGTIRRCDWLENFPFSHELSLKFKVMGIS
jgi:hypothetical protein